MGTETHDAARRAVPLTSEGRIEVERGYQIAYRVFGTGSRTLLGLHGGPGVSSRYLDRLAEVVGGDLKLVLYDQLGGGDSIGRMIRRCGRSRASWRRWRRCARRLTWAS